MTLRVGLIGYGLAGRVFHAPLLQAAGFEVTRVATGRSDEIARDLPAAIVVSDPISLATCVDVDLVVIASPNDTHYPLAMAALRAGRAVVIDKPFTTTVAEADELIATAQTHGCLLSVFHNRRWDSDFLTLKSVIARGDLGEVVSYQCRFDRFRAEVRDRWREQSIPGAGLFFDLGPHLIDQALQLFGWPDWLHADMQYQRAGTQVDDGFQLTMGKGRQRILLGGTMLAAAPEPKFVVHGTAGSFVKSGIDVQEVQLKAGLRPGDAGFAEEPASDAAHVTKVRGENFETAVIPTFRGEYSAYYAGIRAAMEGNASQPPVLAQQARDTMRIIEAARRSHRDGVRISLAE